MIRLFHEQALIVKKKPEIIANVAHRLIHSAAKEHHPQNKLLPAEDVQQLLNILADYELTNTSVYVIQQILLTCIHYPQFELSF